MSDAAERQMAFLFALRQRGVMDKRVLEAMEKVDRGAFVKGLFAERAYEDMPLPIACGQTISQPSVVGLMTQALNVQPRDKVLVFDLAEARANVLAELVRELELQATASRPAQVVSVQGAVRYEGRLPLQASLLGDGAA